MHTAPRVLVVDDDPSMKMLLTYLLGRAGFEVVFTTSANEALAAIAKARVDVLLVDQNLGGTQNGVELIGSLRAAQPDVPAVLMTAYPRPGLLKGEKLQGYLPKPFERPEAVVEALKKALEFSQLMKKPG